METEQTPLSVETHTLPTAKRAKVQRRNRKAIEQATVRSYPVDLLQYVVELEEVAIYHRSAPPDTDNRRVEIAYAGQHIDLPYNEHTRALLPGMLIHERVDTHGSLDANDWEWTIQRVEPWADRVHYDLGPNLLGMPNSPLPRPTQ